MCVCVRACVCLSVSVCYNKLRSVSIDWPIHWTISISASGNGTPPNITPTPMFMHFALKHFLLSATSQNLPWALNRLCPPVHLLVLGRGLPLGIALEEKVAACSQVVYKRGRNRGRNRFPLVSERRMSKSVLTQDAVWNWRNKRKKELDFGGYSCWTCLLTYDKNKNLTIQWNFYLGHHTHIQSRKQSSVIHVLLRCTVRWGTDRDTGVRQSFSCDISATRMHLVGHLISLCITGYGRHWPAGQ